MAHTTSPSPAERERAEVKANLQARIPPGSQLHLLRTRSHRHVAVLVAKAGQIDNVTGRVAKLCGLRWSPRYGDISVGGAQFNPCDHVADLVARALGYQLPWVEL